MIKTATFFVFFAILTPRSGHADHSLTDADINQAKQARAMAVQLGLDKVDPEKWVDVGGDMVKNDMKKKITPQERRALVCMAKKAQEMQFNSPIQTYARYMTDKEFEKATTKEFEKQCGLDDLLDK